MLHGVRLLLFGAALLLAACDARSGRIPAYNDMDGLRAVAMSLSPWADSSPDQSNDGLTPGEEGSDRKTFQDWANRYRSNEIYGQHRRDYEPFRVPGSVGQALADQRAYEVEEGRRRVVARAEDERRRVQEDAEFQRQWSAGRQQLQAEVARRSALEAEQAKQQEAVAAQSNAEAAKEAERAAAAQEARVKCINERDEAAYSAGKDYKKVLKSFPDCLRIE